MAASRHRAASAGSASAAVIGPRPSAWPATMANASSGGWERSNAPSRRDDMPGSAVKAAANAR
ncbi:MAG: hypothetical protein QM733_23060 [Ilumatobacteraceae bacterium]